MPHSAESGPSPARASASAQRLMQAHAWIAACWLVALPNSNSAEGILFAALCVVSLLRWRELTSDWEELWRAPPVKWFIALLGLQWASLAWGPAVVTDLLTEFPRTVFIPFLIWPARDRWPLLVKGFLFGSLIAAAVVIARTGYTRGLVSPGLIEQHGKDLGMYGAAWAAAAALVLALPNAPLSLGWMSRVAIAGTVITAIWLGGQRTPLLAAGAAALVVLVGGWTSRARQPGRWWVVLGMCGAIAITGSVFSGKLIKSVTIVSESEPSSMTDAALAAASSYRAQLALGALAIWKSSPLVGVGAKGFHPAWKRLCETAPASIRLPPDSATAASPLRTAHNGYLDELACRGVLGLAVLCALLVSIVMAARRSPFALPLTAVMTVWMVLSLANATTKRGTFQAILACLVTAAAVQRPQPTRSQSWNSLALNQ